MLNWRDTVTAKQNAMEGPDSQGRGKQETIKQIKHSKTQYFLLRKSNSITSGRLRPEGTATTKGNFTNYMGFS
jgi:hypothetical protein